MDPVTRCPCGTGLSYGECCGPIHAGGSAPTAERLMRSRFTAFAIGDADYLLHSWHPSTRPPTLELDAGMRWYRLDILDRVAGGLLDAEGVVEFEAFYRAAAGLGDARRPDARGSRRERSRFLRHEGRWTYESAV